MCITPPSAPCAIHACFMPLLIRGAGVGAAQILPDMRCDDGEREKGSAMMRELEASVKIARAIARVAEAARCASASLVRALPASFQIFAFPRRLSASPRRHAAALHATPLLRPRLPPCCRRPMPRRVARPDILPLSAPRLLRPVSPPPMRLLPDDSAAMILSDAARAPIFRWPCHAAATLARRSSKASALPQRRIFFSAAADGATALMPPRLFAFRQRGPAPPPPLICFFRQPPFDDTLFRPRCCLIDAATPAALCFIEVSSVFASFCR